MNERDFSLMIRKYIFGFAGALALSVLGYVIVTGQLLSDASITMAVLLLLATLQLVIQLVCFLHLGLNKRSRSRTTTLTFTIAMMLVIVVGSLWIMKNLDYRMGMNSQAMDDYMLQQNKKGF